MDCCNYPQYRAAYGWQYPAYAPVPYAAYTPHTHAYYAPHAHDPYARYAAYHHYDVQVPPQHAASNDHVTSMEYGAYASKEGRVRRTMARREVRALTPSHQLSLPPTPPLECGLSGRGGGYCEPQMWPHYQSGVMGVTSGWSGVNTFGGGWMSRGPNCTREHLRHSADISRPFKRSHLPPRSPACTVDGRSTPFSAYETTEYAERSRTNVTPDYGSRNIPTPAVSDYSIASRDCLYPETPRPPPEEKRQPVTVPLPAFQQAFGSTEIGRFAEAFSRTEVALDDASSETYSFEGFSEWDGHSEPLWSSQPPAPREIKCEENV